MRLPLLVLAAALAPAAAAAQVSPGELSRFHQALEGIRNCQACHEPARGVTAARCLTCHTALALRIDAGQGLHARPDHRSCERCHVEHQGRGFELVFWGRGGRPAFDHALTGFVLRGAHGALRCEACHQPGRITDPGALSRGGANLARTFLGLRASCGSCHADPHRGQFGERTCTSCHGEAAWTPPSGFDHAHTGFPLAGGHARLACARCHTRRADGVVAFAGISPSCSSCHRDPHEGRFGGTCADCHGLQDWRQVRRGRIDHERTRFPLTGRHRSVACAGCHATRAAGAMRFRGTPFATCADCHRDPHAGRLGARCEDCHDTGGWGRAASRGFDHDLTRFPLRGGHAALGCASCHRGGRLTPAHERCTDCHADRHAGQLARREDGGRCEACHDVAGWEAVHFSVDDHARTSYPLAGAHRAVPCDACHREVPIETIRALGFAKGAAPPRTEQLRFASTACAECHRDPHAGQFARGGRTDCARCHRTTAWTDVAFDHDRETRFPLVGAHRAVPCAGCHRRHTGAGAVVRYSGLGTACTDCHGAPVAKPRGER
jgi:hypothetical protein